MSIFLRHRFRFAAFFYFIGLAQMIFYMVGRLPASLAYLYFGPSGIMTMLWEVMSNIGLGILFLAVGWLMTSVSARQENTEPRTQNSTRTQ